MNGYRNNDGASLPTGIRADALPPHNLEAERGVIGSALQDRHAADEALAIVQPADFYRDSHRLIWEAVAALRGDGQPADAITVAESLTRAGVYLKAGGDETIEACVLSVPHAANAGYYAQIVRQKAIARALVEAGEATRREVYANRYTADELLERAEARVFAVANAAVVGDTTTAAALAPAVLDRIAARQAGQFSGLTTGFAGLDEMIDGFHPGQLIVLAARPGCGKSALAGDFARWIAIDCGRPVLFVSLEMAGCELAERFIAALADVDAHAMRTGQLAPVDLESCRAASADLGLSRLLIDDTPIRTASQIAANALRAKARDGIDLVVVDYLQLVEGEDRRGASRQEQVTRISRRLKVLAKQLGCPVLALSQLNRKPEEREGGRPRLSDLRESGAIEQDADVVLLLHRPELIDPNDRPGEADLIVAKNRNGATGAIKLRFRKSRVKFVDLAGDVVDQI